MSRIVAAGTSVALLALFLTVGRAVALEGEPAPDLSLPDLGGKLVQLSQLKGKVVVVNFWATWCRPCREEIPDFVRLHKEHRGHGLEIIGVAMNKGKEEAVRAFVKESEMAYTIVIGETEVARRWLVRGIPWTFIVDREGKVARVIAGMTDRPSLETEIQPLLGTVEPPAAHRQASEPSARN